MSLKTSTARANIKARILAEVPAIKHLYTSQLPKDVQPTLNAYGELEPYAVVRFGRPVPEFGRTLGDSEKDYPHTWPLGVFVYASDGDTVNDLIDDLDQALLAWSPEEGNMGPIRGSVAYSYDFPSTDNMPARIEIQRFYTCLINLRRE